MKKQKKVGSRFKMTASHQSLRSRSREMQPEDLARYVHLAEKQVLPLIKKTHMDAGAAQILLAQYTQALITENPVSSLESGMTIANTVLTLWQEGYYTPSSEYPFTLEETLQELQRGLKAKADYVEWFQPFTPLEAGLPRDLGKIAGGIVKHPETHLWQIWMIIEGPCEYFGAYRDPAVAQQGLNELVSLARRGASPTESVAMYQKLSSQWSGDPK